MSVLAGVRPWAPASVPASLCLHRSDLELAKRVHEALIPGLSSHPRFDMDVQFRPRDWLGGDYCQAALVGDETLYLTLCDVTGHGIGSAMLAARVSTLVRGILEQCPAPRAVLGRVDRFYRDFYAAGPEELPLSFLACRLDLGGCTLDYAAAGHPGPLILRRGSAGHEQLPTRNLLIGVEASCLLEPAEGSVALGPGDRVALFTDGVTDAILPDSSLLGVAGLARMLQGGADLDVFRLGRSVVEAIEGDAGQPTRDDRTLVLLEIR